MTKPRGNPNPKPYRPWATKKAFTESLQRQLEVASGKQDPRAMDAVAYALIRIALNPKHPYQFQAIKEIGDRIEGKPTLKIAGDADHDPINMTDQARDLLIAKLNRIAASPDPVSDTPEPGAVH